MIAEVIPYARTIRGKDFFDYVVPKNLTVKKGSLVKIEFRSRLIIGLVRDLKKNSAIKKLKPVIALSTTQLPQPEHFLLFLTWFANHYFISQAHAFKSMHYPFLKKRNFADLDNWQENSSHSQKISIPKKNIESIKNALAKVKPNLPNVVLYNNRADCLAFYQGIIKRSTGSVLIIVPEYQDVLKIAEALNNKDIVALTKNPSPSVWTALEIALQKKSKKIVIGTKKTAFLWLGYFATVILDQEEARSHKQYELNPRYQTREVILQNINLLTVPKPQLIFCSTAPNIETYFAKKSFKINISRTWSAKNIFTVNMLEEKMKKNYSWFSEKLMTEIHQSQKTFLFFNRLGNLNLAVCLNCSAVLPADKTKCPNCQSSHLKQTHQGTQQLEITLKKYFKNKKIVRLDSTREYQLAELQKADIILGTEKIFRVMSLADFDLVGIISVDHLLVYPHFRANERVFQLLTKIFSASQKIIIQTHAPDNMVIKLAILNNYDQFYQQEIKIRKILNLPPFSPYFQLLDTKNKQKLKPQKYLSEYELKPSLVVDYL
ncbi:MAG: hypothetical protein A2233_04535 [Candidatus Kerfeldbacteria bacterium RIFOXYA2_FULL_38_24]|uniref:Primosomal protein N' 3' DNA-binding domain-containing protein n=1 Tax=Candidatus Kerfeldbacteria bacterium RIFOXYB2_FULL_38_14 TaxID=1798547 RepID=A0A1G2BAS5_9BACT|nr:MAG: hypothetical protein A2319_05700 [Candidatus Kerfeldbacteria bacterium RIFOXYB2_FULL_38_14]OGY87531.1 MAG: hypothetical protein A2233_04535 [Candidatus Kerfeldbacteria bacterium RIFOXYA2_FULL_38_24]